MTRTRISRWGEADDERRQVFPYRLLQRGGKLKKRSDANVAATCYKEIKLERTADKSKYVEVVAVPRDVLGLVDRREVRSCNRDGVAEHLKREYR